MFAIYHSPGGLLIVMYDHIHMFIFLCQIHNLLDTLAHKRSYFPPICSRSARTIIHVLKHILCEGPGFIPASNGVI